MPSLKVGINYPWSERYVPTAPPGQRIIEGYGRDIGAPQDGLPETRLWNSMVTSPAYLSGAPAPTTPLPKLESDLRMFKDMGIFAVRLWILGRGHAYGTPTRDSATGAWSTPVANAPSALHPMVVADFTRILQTFNNVRGIQLLPVLVAPGMCRVPETGQPPSFMGGGRANLISDRAHRQIFLRDALQPLLDVCNSDGGRYRDIIHSWESMNEPDLAVAGVDRGLLPGENQSLSADEAATVRSGQGVGFATRDGVEDFLVEASALIEAARFQSTAGFYDYRSIEKFAARARARRGATAKISTKYQFHYYGAPANLPAASDFSGHSVFIGEASSSSDPAVPMTGFDTRASVLAATVDTRTTYDQFLDWVISLGSSQRPAALVRRSPTLTERLDFIENNLYEEVFLWAALDAPNSVRLSEARINNRAADVQSSDWDKAATRRDIYNFLRTRRPLPTPTR